MSLPTEAVCRLKTADCLSLPLRAQRCHHPIRFDPCPIRIPETAARFTARRHWPRRPRSVPLAQSTPRASLVVISSRRCRSPLGRFPSRCRPLSSCSRTRTLPRLRMPVSIRTIASAHALIVDRAPLLAQAGDRAVEGRPGCIPSLPRARRWRGTAARTAPASEHLRAVGCRRRA